MEGRNGENGVSVRCQGGEGCLWPPERVWTWKLTRLLSSPTVSVWEKEERPEEDWDEGESYDKDQDGDEHEHEHEGKGRG